MMTASLTSMACGFCNGYLSFFLMPALPAWGTVFILWCLLCCKYAEPGRSLAWGWLLAAPFVLVVGALVSTEVWSFFLIAWTVVVFRRLRLCKTQVHTLICDKSIQRRWCFAERFHRTILWLLLGGIAGSGMRYYVFPPF
ncbi:MAG: hypothetical protein AMXMBFR7_03740 [Planctomycetota bacterium]